jgi:hypothetical protein
MILAPAGWNCGANVCTADVVGVRGLTGKSPTGIFRAEDSCGASIE